MTSEQELWRDIFTLRRKIEELERDEAEALKALMRALDSHQDWHQSFERSVRCWRRVEVCRAKESRLEAISQSLCLR